MHAREGSGGRTFELGPVHLLDCSVSDAVGLVGDAVREGRALPVHLCNAFTISLAAKNPLYANAFGGEGLNLVDGTPVTWFFRGVARQPARGPVRGAELMRRLLDEPGLRHYLYGGTDDVLAKLRTEIAAEHSTAEIVGGLAPPFRELTDQDVELLVADLELSRAQVVWVGLGTPKQDFLVDRLAQVHNCVAIGVGAAFDFLSGNKPEAPGFLHGTGLEWTYRLLKEPGRLWRRYLWGNAVFVSLVIRSLINSRQRGRGRRARPQARG
jgi:N-acetylglucosaminyldiphosphoundecaprenol N-acetyl-beta-D-mannosaminyltransferase